MQPQQAEHGRQHHRGDVVDGERDAGGGGDVGRVGDFLEVTVHGDCQREEHMVGDVEQRGDSGVLHEGVTRENSDQPGVFKQQRAPLAPFADEFSDERREVNVDRAVHQKQHGQRGRAVAEPLHHQKPGEHHEDLAARAGQKCQRVIQPVAAAQDEFFALLVFLRKVRVCDSREQNQRAGQPAGNDVDIFVIQIQHGEAGVNQREREQRGERADRD